jgi:hypothetical protein
MFISQRLLHRMQRAVGRGQPLYTSDFAAISLDRQHQTRAHSEPIDDDRAGAAHSMFATDMHAGTARIDTQEVTQRFPAFYCCL